MIELNDILNEWKIDSEIPYNKYDEVSQQTPTLHAKYLEYLSLTKLRLKKAEFQQKNLLKEKWLYYDGKMPQEDMIAKGWKYDPFDGLNPDSMTKHQKEHYYDTDIDIQQSEEKIVYLKTIIETLTEIVDNLKWRHQTIGNIIRWRQFSAGE